MKNENEPLHQEEAVRPSYRDIPGCENLVLLPCDRATMAARQAGFLALILAARDEQACERAESENRVAQAGPARLTPELAGQGNHRKQRAGKADQR